MSKSIAMALVKTRGFAGRFVILLAALVTTQVRADNENPPPGEPTLRAPRYGGVDRWENALDVKTTNFYGRAPSVGDGSPVILTAKWNRKFETGTFLGLTASSMAQPLKNPLPELNSDLMTYYGGLNLGQNIFASPPFRLTVDVSAGIGSMFIRVQPEEGASRMNRADYRYVEPGAFFTFFEYAGLEFGLVGTFRSVRLLTDYAMDGRVLGKNGDYSSQAFGLTFRTQRR